MKAWLPLRGLLLYRKVKKGRNEMIEYFYSDIIIDPTSKEAEKLIGKEVYASLIPTRCLMIANGRCRRPYRCFLESIEPKSTFPFHVRVVDTDSSESASYKSFPCIIPKKD